MYDLVLKNCNVINENVESQVDIAIKNQRIEKIAASVDSESSEEHDLSGKLVIPGLIDDQGILENQVSLTKAKLQLNQRPL